MLHSHRARQRELYLMLGVSAAASDRVFANEVGDPIRPNSVGQAFRRLVEAADVPIIRLHDLRQWYATTQLDAGESLPAVAARIGDHVETLAKVYAHRGHSSDRAAADDLGARLDSGS